MKKLALLLLAYAVTTVPMEHANSAQELVDHEDEIALVQQPNEDEAPENEWASLSWWTKSFNGWFVFDGGRRLLKNYWAPRTYSMKGFQTVEQFIQNGQHPSIVQAVKNVHAKMPILAGTYIEIDKDLDMPAAAAHKLICINPSLFMLFNEGERESAIGHESRHVYHNDQIVGNVWRMASPFVTYGILKAYNKASNYLLTALQKRMDKNSTAYRWLREMKIINTALSHNVITHLCLQTFLDRSLIRFKELRADREEATLLNNAQATISSFKKMWDPDFRSIYASAAGYDAMDSDAVSPYPFAMRIKALEALKQ